MANARTRWKDDRFHPTEKGVRRLFVQQVDGGAPLPVNYPAPGLAVLQRLVTRRQPASSSSPSQGLYIVPDAWVGRHVRSPHGAGLPRLRARNCLLWGSWSPDGQTDCVRLRRHALRPRNRGKAAGSQLLMALILPLTGLVLRRQVDRHSSEGIRQFSLSGNLAPSSILVVQASGGTPIRVTDSLSPQHEPGLDPGSPRRFCSSLIRTEDATSTSSTSRAREDPTGPAVRITTGLNPDRIALSADGKRLAWSISRRDLQRLESSASLEGFRTAFPSHPGHHRRPDDRDGHWSPATGSGCTMTRT